MAQQTEIVFNPGFPPDIQHGPLIREEAIDWLETNHPGVISFTTGQILRMAGEKKERRWLIGRLRQKGIGTDELFTLPSAADALAVLFLRSRGIKFKDAAAAVVEGEESSTPREPRYGGVWNRLIRIAMKRMRRRLTARLLGSAVFSLLRRPGDHPNCMIIITPLGEKNRGVDAGKAKRITHDRVYQTVLKRPAPSCWVLSPFREVLFLDADQLPTRAEVTSRHFLELIVQTEREVYSVQLGTMETVSVSPGDANLEFIGRILDIVFLDFEEFVRKQASELFEAAIVPELGSADDLQLWLITKLFETIYPGSLSEISESSQDSESESGRVLASSNTKPWEPSLWDPPKALEMLSGYASRVGVPLIVQKVEPPWTSLIESVEPEMRFLDSRDGAGDRTKDYSAMALPIHLSSGDSVGSLYLLTPRISESQLDTEVRVLTVFSRIIGEIVERQRAAIHTARVSTHIANFEVLKHDQFRAALLKLIERKSKELDGAGNSRRDLRLPFLLLSAHGPDADGLDPDVSGLLKGWLVETLSHLEWRSFVRSHLSWVADDPDDQSFIGELPGTGVVIALDRLVSKNEMDQIRHAFPTTINSTTPTNSPVKLVAWVLDVPAYRFHQVKGASALQALADDVESWARDVATIVDDIAQSEILARSDGNWDQALRRIRRAIGRDGGRRNGYLYRMAAECSFSTGDWPGALKYSQTAVELNERELGSGSVRSMCLEADAHICLVSPVRAWDLYSSAATERPSHPLPRYYRGHALLLMARLLREFENELRRTAKPPPNDIAKINGAIETLVEGTMDDLTAAADLLDRWGLIPESSQYRNFHLVPTLLGQGAGYLLTNTPGPAASRLQSARRSFPKDDLFFREYLFAKCWEQGVHRQYGALVLGNGWAPLRERLTETFGLPWSGA
ncbi:MAG: hypothetical protein IH867_12020 [Chloroflexi bacterium]|nr:hypothetical protein [Chloroflexota bacterium]